MTSKPRPKILFYDIETTPSIGTYYGNRYERNILGKIKHSEIFSFAYKWHGTRETWCYTQEKRSEEKLIHYLHKLFQDADLIVAHYGDQFDQKVVKARMLFYGMKPPKILTSIDTKKIASRYFKFDGNSLDELGEYLGLGRKVKVSVYELWEATQKGKRWDELAKYNKQDVILLEKIYDKFLPWIENHPNIARILEPHEPWETKCPKCGSEDVIRKGFGRSGAKRQWHCKACGGWHLVSIKL